MSTLVRRLLHAFSHHDLAALLLPIALIIASSPAVVLSQELATFSVDPHGHDFHGHRQSFCDRYEQFSKGEIELRDGLSGMKLNVAVARAEFLNYHLDTGLDPEDPGILADIMDNLAERGNFTWRNSFAVYNEPQSYNKTWTEFLVWAIDKFDVVVDWYDNTVERMELGASFLEPWYDGSLILIDQRDPPVPSTVNLLNWAKPFDIEVWVLILFTIVVSAIVYQLIEYLNGEREDRSLWQWVSDNMYLSSLNFTQNFEYAPNSLAGRVFGVSASIWALVITATYTANLASLFVEDLRPARVVDSIEQAVALGVPICALQASNHEDFLRKRYKKAIVVPQVDQPATFKALRRGDCGLVLAAKDTWFTFEKESAHNPACDLEWVGRVMKSIRSGFAVKSDAGDKCTSFIRDVMTVHLVQYINDGDLENTWQNYRSKTQDMFCDANGVNVIPTDIVSERRRLGGDDWLRQQQPQQSTNVSSLAPRRHHHHRRMKGGGNGGAAGGAAAAAAIAQEGTSPNKTALSVKQMLGTFVLHWSCMALSIFISVVAVYYERWEAKRLEAKNLVKEQRKYRSNGPIIGMPPHLNTYVIQSASDDNAAGATGTPKQASGEEEDCARPTLNGKKGSSDNDSTEETRPTGARAVGVWNDHYSTDGYSVEILQDDFKEQRGGVGWIRSDHDEATSKKGSVENRMGRMEDRMGRMEDKMDMLMALMRQQTMDGDKKKD